MNTIKKPGIALLILLLCLFAITALAQRENSPPEKAKYISDHFDGNTFFNPKDEQPMAAPSSNQPPRGLFSFAMRWLFNNNMPPWPSFQDIPQSIPPSTHVTAGKIRIIVVGHSTFLIQMDGLNMLTDPIWSDRCSPVSWAGPKRHKPPGLKMEDLPPLDAVLISHNHYDHLDLPTLSALTARGTRRTIVSLGNTELVKSSGMPLVEELDWWQSVSLSPEVRVTLVPARHFSLRIPWDRNKTLWGGFIISGPSGNVYYAGDTGYGSHFREIARRFAPIKIALLPIAPFRPRKVINPSIPDYSINHMGPAEAVQAHIDLQAQMSVAAHFQVFQLGWDGFDDAVNGLAAALMENMLSADDFIAPEPGRIIEFCSSSGKTPTQAKWLLADR